MFSRRFKPNPQSYGIPKFKPETCFSKEEKANQQKLLKITKSFLKERKKQQKQFDERLTHLNSLLKNKSMDKETHERSKDLLLLAHEQTRAEIIKKFFENPISLN